jgi:hypothetical protein
VFDVRREDWVIQFKVRLQGINREQWYELASKLNNIKLNSENDLIFWKWSKNKSFTVKSVYEHLTRDDNGAAYNRVWKAKFPEKIKIFMWLIEQKSILTKDNMLKRKWKGNPRCYFCASPETNDHLLFECPIAKVACGVIAICFQQDSRPSSYEQLWVWIVNALPSG